MDDWAYARGALLFAHGAGIHYFNWPSMPQLGQWLWACPFVWLLGDSFFALRVSTITLSWLGLWAFYDLLRQEEVPADRAALATGALAFNPLFFLLQGTFMTDVPALSLALVALAGYGRGLRSGGSGWLVAGCLVACLAVLTRQSALAAPLGAAALLWKSPLRGKSSWWLGVLVPAALAVAAHIWFQQRNDIIVVEPRPLPPRSLVLLPFVVILWCGLATLPLSLVRPLAGSWRSFAVTLLVLLLFVGYWLYHGRSSSHLDGLFPYTGTVLTPWGVQGDLYVGERPIELGLGLRAVLTVLCCLAGAFLILEAVAWVQRRRPLGPLVLFSLFQVPFLLVAPALWDRYVFILFPGAIALAAGEPSVDKRFSARWSWWPGGLVLALGAAVSVALMHDWLSWKAAGWELGQRAVSRGMNPLDMEGGFEWDGWYVADQQPPQRASWRDLFLGIVGNAGEPKGLTLPTTRVWFPQVTGAFALSFSPLDGAEVVDSNPYRLWLTPGERRFYLVRTSQTAAGRR
jgi:4-amino-4-deoxy-L-arabinose transferase-like glycosyltransferase